MRDVMVGLVLFLLLGFAAIVVLRERWARARSPDHVGRLRELADLDLVGEPVRGSVVVQRFEVLSSDPNTTFQAVWLRDHVVFLRIGAALGWTPLDIPVGPLDEATAAELQTQLRESSSPKALMSTGLVVPLAELDGVEPARVGGTPGVVLHTRHGDLRFRLVDGTDAADVLRIAGVEETPGREVS